MSTKAIRASSAHASCDVCGRTLLRGERSAVYIHGGARKDVCELCEAHVVHEGWMREGTVAPYAGDGADNERRQSLLSRLRARRAERGRSSERAPSLADELDGRSWSEREPRALREPRHVRAVPTDDGQKVAAAMALFNSSEHTRTIAGVARSLGAPSVSLLPSQERPSQVQVIVAWELCWYRYEVDLSDDEPSVRLVSRGYELDELTPPELEPIASIDERGSLHALGVE